MSSAVAAPATLTAASRVAVWTWWGAGVVAAALSGVTGVLAWRSLRWPLIHDAPIMHYAAWLLSQGAVPYRDFFDMNLPGAYLLHWLVLALAGPEDWGFRFFDLFWLALTSALIAGYCAKFGRWSSLSASLLFATYHLAGGAWRAGQRDFLLSPFLLAGLWGTARARESGRRVGFVAGGLAFGAAVLVKPHALLFLPLLALAALRPGPSGLGSLSLAVTAWALPPLAAGLWLGWTGGLIHFLEMLTGYLLPLYAPLERVSPFLALSWHPYGVALWSLVSLLAALSLALAARDKRLDLRRRFLALGCLYGIIHFVVQGKGWEYHLYPLALFALLLATTELDAVVNRGGRLAPALLGGGLVALTALLALKGIEAGDAGWITAKERRVARVVAQLQGRIPRGESVQVLDTTEGGVHALLRLGVRQPTRFLYDFHFFHDLHAPYIQRLRSEILRALRARPPRFIALFERGWPRGGYERLDQFPDLREWLLASYTLDGEGDGYRIYARR